MKKILVLNSDTEGVFKFRFADPHLCMKNTLDKISNKPFDVDMRLLSDSTIPLLDENFLKQYKIIVYNKVLPFNNPQYKVMFNMICKKYDIKIIYDIDDSYCLTNTHPNYKTWKDNNMQQITMDCISGADMITTTTEIFQKNLLELNKNVTVLPNAINFKEYQFNNRPLYKGNKISFIWIGGITHLVDLKLMEESFKNLDKDMIEKMRLILCGFDLRMRMPNGEMSRDDPKKSHWTHFEMIFSNNYKYIKNAEYKKYLMSYDDTNFGIKEDFMEEFYQRHWTKSIPLYATHYHEAESGKLICFAPLKNNNTFNEKKSQLKLIESGAFGHPLIASNYAAYTIDDIEGKTDGKQKGFLIDEDDKMGWKRAIKYYLDNPEKIKEHGQNNYEHIKKNYDMEVVNEKRMKMYMDLMK